MSRRVFSFIGQIALFLALSFAFSAFPFLAGLKLNKSSLFLSIIVTWYALIVPVLFLVLAWLLYRREHNSSAFVGRAWIGVGLWFALQYLLHTFSGGSMLLKVLALPYVLSGGNYYPAGSILFIAGGIAFLTMGLVRPRLESRAAKPTLAGWTSIAILSVFFIFIPLFVLVNSRLLVSSADRSRVPTEKEIFEWVEDVYNMGERLPGSEADLKTIAYLQAKLREFGFQDVKAEPFVFDYWEPLSHSLRVKSGTGPDRKLTCFYVPYSGPTPSSGISAEMVYLGEATEEDFKGRDVSGKIILVDIPPVPIGWSQMKLFTFAAYDPENTAENWKHPYPVGWMQKYQKFYKRAEELGVAGIVSILRGYPDMGEFTYYAPYDGELRRVPSLYIREADGDALKAELKRKGMTATMVLEAMVVKGGGRTATVYGVLPGNSRTNLVVHSHHDAPWRSGVEDSSGVAMVLSLAKYYAGVPREQRDRTLVFLFNGSHMVGSQSNLAFSRNHRNDIMANMLYDIAIEHVSDDYNPPAKPTGLVEPRGIFVSENPVVVSLVAKALARYNIYRTLIFPTGTPLGVPTDAGPWQREGYRIISNISGPAWLFDKNDTLERVARDQLVPLTMMYIDLIDGMDVFSDLMLTFDLNLLAIVLTVLMTPLLMLNSRAVGRKKPTF
ncbi:MAG: M28 family peptidase [Proteobacteria bacterium]|nr:M28 family peptidase [Pseudomonadota bacterium]